MTTSTPSPLTETCLAAPLALDIRWRDGRIVGMHLTWAEGRQAALTTALGRAMQAALMRYVAGEAPTWPELPLAWQGVSPFARQVLEELARVPSGQQVSYGWLAAKVGRPKAARAVGRVMAGNPFPLIYPCHRVVGADGSLTGFGPGLAMKRYLLEREGALEKKNEAFGGQGRCP